MAGKMSTPDASAKGAFAARRGRPALLPPEQSGNRTVMIGLDLLKAVVAAAKPLPLTDIAEQMKMSPSRTHRYLSSLCQAGFLRKDIDSGRYDVATGAIELGIAAAARVDGMRLAAKVMEDLTSRTGLVSYLCVWGSNGPTVIRRELGTVQTAVRVREGSNLSLLTATGRIFFTYLARSQTSDLLQRDMAEWNAIAECSRRVTVEDMERFRKRVKNAQIARTKGMRHPTWTAFSCPVFGAPAKFIMALTLIGVTKLFDTRLNGEVAGHLKAAARLLTSSMKNPVSFGV